MPQIEQLSDVFVSQLFWLILVFGVIYFAIGRGMLPKIEATVEARDQRIAEDLATAERARAAADETEEAYRQRIADARSNAVKVTQEAKQASARESETRIAKANDAISGKLAKAETEIGSAKDAALSELEAIAAEAAQEMVSKLSGGNVSPAAARKAVQEALANV